MIFTPVFFSGVTEVLGPPNGGAPWKHTLEDPITLTSNMNSNMIIYHNIRHTLKKLYHNKGRSRMSWTNQRICNLFWCHQVFTLSMVHQKSLGQFLTMQKKSGLGFCRKLVRTKIQQDPDKASKHNRVYSIFTALVLLTHASTGVVSTFSYRLSSLHYTS